MADTQLMLHNPMRSSSNDGNENIFFIPIALIAMCKMLYETYELQQLKEEKATTQRELEMSRQHQRVLEQDNEMIEILMEYIATHMHMENEAKVDDELPGIEEDELTAHILAAITGTAKDAKDITKELTVIYPGVTKKEVNSRLYSMKAAGIVKQMTTKNRPIWSA
jgi:uncharacterized protein YeeX (DUF496 family)